MSCRATGPANVKFKILFCGVCHSDLHQIRNDWGSALYPMVAGYVNFLLNLNALDIHLFHVLRTCQKQGKNSFAAESRFAVLQQLSKCF
jgi:hypothetical protein